MSSSLAVEEQDPEKSLPTIFCVMGEDLYSHLDYHLGSVMPLVGMYDVRELSWIASFRRSGEKPSGFSIENIALLYLERIQKADPRGPYVLGGFSAGGAIAFEVARKLRAQGKEVTLVVLFDTVALGSLPTMTLTQRLAQRWMNFKRYGVQNLKIKLKESQGRLINKLRVETSKLARSSKVNDKRRELDESREQFFREALLSYKPAPYEGDVLLLLARNAFRPAGFVVDKSLGWENFVKGNLTICQLPGDHVDVLQEPNVCIVAETIIQQTKRAISQQLST